MTGVQGYEGAQKRAKQGEIEAGRQEAMQALQSGGDTRGALARLIGVGDYQGANAISAMEKARMDSSGVFGTPIYGTDDSGNTRIGTFDKGGKFRQIETPGFRPSPGIRTIDTGTGTAIVDSRTGLPVSGGPAPAGTQPPAPGQSAPQRGGNFIPKDTGTPAYNTQAGKDYAETFGSIQKEGRAAGGTISSLNLMEQATHDPNFYSGTASQTVTGFKRALASLGVSAPDGAKPNELFNALSNKLVLDASGGSFGTGFSNADRDYIAATVPALQNTPEGNRALIGVQRKIYQRKQEVAQFARDYVKSNGKLDAGFDDALAKWSEANPLFPKQAQPQNRTQSGVPWRIVQ